MFLDSLVTVKFKLGTKMGMKMMEEIYSFQSGKMACITVSDI